MTAVYAPFGLRPVFHPSGLDRAQALADGIENQYSENILKGAPVRLNANGQLVHPGGEYTNFLGAFAGVEWTDVTGRRRVSNFWPANTEYQPGSCVAYYYDDANIVYEIQANGPVAQNKMGDQCNISGILDGSTATGLSASYIDSTGFVGPDTTAMVVVRNVAPYPGNDWGDAFTIVRVSVSRPQLAASFPAI